MWQKIQCPGPRFVETETEQCYCSPKETCTFTNKEQVLGFHNLQKYSPMTIRQDIILAIFTPLNDDWLISESKCLFTKCSQHTYLIRSQNRDILHNVLGGLADIEFLKMLMLKCLSLIEIRNTYGLRNVNAYKMLMKKGHYWTHES